MLAHPDVSQVLASFEDDGKQLPPAGIQAAKTAFLDARRTPFDVADHVVRDGVPRAVTWLQQNQSEFWVMLEREAKVLPHRHVRGKARSSGTPSRCPAPWVAHR